MKTFYQALFCSSLIALAACNQNPQVQPKIDPPIGDPPPVVSQPTDTTAPKIVAQTPINGASDVVARDPITLTFSEAIKPETANAQTLSLKVSGATIATRISLSTDGKTATIAPENYADLGLEDASLSVEVGKLTDLAGNALEGAGDWNWKVPAWLELSGFKTVLESDTGSMELVLDKKDVPYLIWGEFTGRRGYDCSGTRKNPVGFYASRFHLKRWQDGSWLSEDLPNLSETISRLNLSVFDSQNQKWMMAETISDGASAASIIRQDSSGLKVADTTQIPSGWAGYPSSAELFVNQQGEAYSAWHTGTALFSEIRHWDGQRWITIGNGLNMRSRDSGRKYIHQAKLSFDGSGHPVVAWSEEQYQDDANWRPTSYLFVRRWDGTKWESLLNGFEGANLYPNTHFVDNWVITSDKTGNPLLAWQEIPLSWYGVQGGPRVVVRRWVGSGWETLSDQANPKNANQYAEGLLKVDSKGHLVNYWLTSSSVFPPDYSKNEIHVTHWEGNSWSSISAVNAGIGRYTVDPDWRSNFPSIRSIDFDQNNNAYIAWMFGCHDQPQEAVVLRQNR